MLPWIKHGSARTPDGTEISLWQRGDEFVVRVGAADLMSTRLHGSEDALAEHGCAGLRREARILIGGLGLGFTLRTALEVLSPQASIEVAEFVPEIVAWLREPVGAGALLDDPRVTLLVRDIVAILRESEARYDAILLDVDNGPDALTQAENRWLYQREGLAAARRALRPGGRLAVWAASEDPVFVRHLGRSGFDARTIRVRAHGGRSSGRGRGARQAIFLATPR